MFSLTRIVPYRQLIVFQAPSITASLIIAESFYKFHSFTLEAVAFLATWYVFDAALNFMFNPNDC